VSFLPLFGLPLLGILISRRFWPLSSGSVRWRGSCWVELGFPPPPPPIGLPFRIVCYFLFLWHFLFTFPLSFSCRMLKVSCFFCIPLFPLQCGKWVACCYPLFSDHLGANFWLFFLRFGLLFYNEPVSPSGATGSLSPVDPFFCVFVCNPLTPRGAVLVETDPRGFPFRRAFPLCDSGRGPSFSSWGPVLRFFYLRLAFLPLFEEPGLFGAALLVFIISELGVFSVWIGTQLLLMETALVDNYSNFQDRCGLRLCL